MYLLPKDPNEVISGGFDWVKYLDGDTIASSTWLAPDGITVVAQGNSATVTSVKLSGGTSGEIYKVVNRITTTTSQETIEETLHVRLS